MECASALEDLQAEATCPICLKYLENPVTISCGHNLCRSCLITSWKDLQRNCFPCPLCYSYCPRGKFSSNLQLANLTKIAKELPIRSSKRKRQEGKFMCKKHKQVLTVFCQKDLEVLCPQCCFSSNHQHHYVWSVQKAAVCHRKQLDRCFELWKQRVERFENSMSMQRRKSLDLKKKVKHKREEIKSEFEQLRWFLQNEQETVLRQLQDEEMEISAKQNEHLTKLSDHASSLKYLLKEIQSTRVVKSELELLARVKRIYHRYKNLKCPETFSFKFKDYGYRLPPQYSGLNAIIQRFQVDVILDPETAHSKLIISGDRKTVWYGNRQKMPPNPRRFFRCPVVLGSEGYNSGRQYWEVEVRDKPEWIVGVCNESLPRRRKNQARIAVQDGLWGIGRCSETNYIALGSKVINLLPKVIPSKIGIFLDFEMNEIYFYNLDDRSLLYTFNDCLTGTLWPYLYAGTDPKPLKICTAKDPE